MEEILKQLIKFKTYEQNPYKEKEILKLYKYVLSLIPEEYKYKIYTRNDNPSLIVYKKSRKKLDIALYSHVDVVEGNPELFEPKIIDNRIYGRGASDMKFTIPAYIKLLQDYKDSRLNIGMWLTPDEETDSKDGTEYLLEKVGLKANVVIVPDGNNGNALVTRSKGMLHFRWDKTGIPGHGAQPWDGENALDILIEAYSELREHKMFTKYGSKKWRNTINLGYVKGGTTINTIAEEAHAKIDIRYISAKHGSKIKKVVNYLTKKHNLEYKEISKSPAFKLDMGDEYSKAFLETLEDLKINYKLTVDHGASDAALFTEYRIPSIIYKPICDGDHSNEEWIDIDSLHEFYKVLKYFIDKSKAK